jgi:hypothetical protein
MRAFLFQGKNRTYILSEVLKKAPPGVYKKDIIKLSIKTKKEGWARVMTPYEAIVIANALLSAVMMDNEARRRLK